MSLLLKDWIILPEDEKRARCGELSKSDAFRLRLGGGYGIGYTGNETRQDYINIKEAILAGRCVAGEITEEERDKELKKYIEELENL